MEYKLFIDGEFIDSHSKNIIEVENPATKEIIGRVPAGDEVDVDLAVKAAHRAFKAFKKTTLEERIKYVEGFKNYLIENMEEIATTISKELGAPLFFAKSSHIERNIDRCNAFIEIAKNYEYRTNFEGGYVVRQPLGVIACLCPWNYPLGQIVQKIIPAILTGNTIVLKPSQMTPLTAYYVVDAFEKAGLPKGVLNLVTGRGSEVGNALSIHPLVKKISFTGSTSGGIEVGKLGLGDVKNLTLELGGKSPAVFLEGANLKSGVRHVLDMQFYNTGQTCSALSRIIVLSSVKEELEKEVVEQYGKYVVGDPLEEGVIVGPLASKKQYDKVIGYIEEGKKTADVLVGDGAGDESKGYYVNPIVFTNVDENSKIAQEEIFGPVLCIIEAKDVEDAIEKANNTIYGLSSAVYGGDVEECEYVASEIDTGQVFVNTFKTDVFIPFGGQKQSGLGREGGVQGFEQYLEIKGILKR